jgi:hypothetical protein
VPPTAAAYLAAHTEDWERPTIRAVQPKRVLALTQEDAWDIYENRVAARLVDHLLAYLDRREDELRRLAKMWNDASDHSSTMAKGTIWRRLRISKLWGEAVQGNEGYRFVEGPLAEISRLRRRVAGLMDSPLYRNVPRKAAVAAALTQTNIFASDPRYRRVATLWQAWASRVQAESKSPRRVYTDYQRLCHGFSSFCLLLALRALDQLRYEPLDLEAPIRAGVPVELKGTDGVVALKLTEDAMISVSAQWGAPLRIVPLPAMFHASLDSDDLARQLDEIERAAPAVDRTLVLYPTSSTAIRQRLSLERRRRLHSLGNDIAARRERTVGFLPVSPWDIGSTERVGRALRWALTGSRLMAYPPAVPSLPGDLDPAAFGGILIADGDRRSRLVRPPKEKTRQRVREAQRARYDEHERLRARIDDLLQRKPLDDRRELKRWNIEKPKLNQELDEAKRRLDELDRFIKRLDEAAQQIERLRECPVCAAPADPDRGFRDRSDQTFRCECADCRAYWGTQTCRMCQSRVPLLRPYHEVSTSVTGDPGWVDDTFGSDVLAVPCAHGQFICVACGDCPCSRVNVETPAADTDRAPIPAARP